MKAAKATHSLTHYLPVHLYVLFPDTSLFTQNIRLFPRTCTIGAIREWVSEWASEWCACYQIFTKKWKNENIWLIRCKKDKKFSSKCQHKVGFTPEKIRKSPNKPDIFTQSGKTKIENFLSGTVMGMKLFVCVSCLNHLRSGGARVLPINSGLRVIRYYL